MAASGDHDRRRASAILAVAAALAVGTTLRLWNLRDQVMAGDELHAVRAALADPISRILFVYREADNCIPLTLWDRVWMDAGLRLTELVVRFPVGLAGLFLLLIGPWWAWRRMGAGVAVAFAWLLALAPLLVFYGRIARPYAPAYLLAFLAIIAFDAWWRARSWMLGIAYVAAATAAVWFFLGVGPLVLSPLLVGVGATAVQRGRDGRSLVLLGACTAVALLALLVPAQETLVPLIALKHAELGVTREEAVEVVAELAGLRSPWWALAWWAGVAAGATALAHRDRWLGALVVTAIVGHAVSIAVLAPVGNQSPVILARYLVPALPLALLALSVALDAASARATRWKSGWRSGRAVVLAAALATLVVGGPFLDPALARSSFAHDDDFLRYGRHDAPPPVEVPAVYAWLGGEPPGAVLELPWHPVRRYSRAIARYQRVHRRSAMVTVLGAVFSDDRMRFRNMVSARAESLLASRARWLVVHRDLGTEESHIAPGVLRFGLQEELRATGVAVARQLRDRWGRADHVDAWTWCWDLDRVRRGGAPPPRRAQRRPRAVSTASSRIAPSSAIVARPSSTLAAAGSPK